jgi:hypothetical protein
MYVKLNNGAVQRFPYSIQDLRQENSNVSFPVVLSNEMLAGFGVFPVTEDARPVTDRFSHAVKRSLPELVNGEWVVLWDILAKSTESIAEQDEHRAAEVRDSRGSKLSATDWTQITDAPLTTEQRAAWSSYRQSLRDLTTQPGFPWEITWPVKP